MPHRELLMFAELGVLVGALGLSVGARRLALSRHWAKQRGIVLILSIFAIFTAAEIALVRS